MSGSRTALIPIGGGARAAAAEHFGAGVDGVVCVWESFSAYQVYRADTVSMSISGARWVPTSAVSGGH